MAEIEARRIEGAKQKIHVLLVTYFPTCRRLVSLGVAVDDAAALDGDDASVPARVEKFC